MTATFGMHGVAGRGPSRAYTGASAVSPGKRLPGVGDNPRLRRI
jgi:hypothetical protein